jgi:hypothetical protein
MQTKIIDDIKNKKEELKIMYHRMHDYYKNGLISLNEFLDFIDNLIEQIL